MERLLLFVIKYGKEIQRRNFESGVIIIILFVEKTLLWVQAIM